MIALLSAKLGVMFDIAAADDMSYFADRRGVFAVGCAKFSSSALLPF